MIPFQHKMTKNLTSPLWLFFIFPFLLTFFQYCPKKRFNNVQSFMSWSTSLCQVLLVWNHPKCKLRGVIIIYWKYHTLPVLTPVILKLLKLQDFPSSLLAEQSPATPCPMAQMGSDCNKNRVNIIQYLWKKYNKKLKLIYLKFTQIHRRAKWLFQTLKVFLLAFIT